MHGDPAVPASGRGFQLGNIGKVGVPKGDGLAGPASERRVDTLGGRANLCAEPSEA
jgi:hypothetical protein